MAEEQALSTTPTNIPSEESMMSLLFYGDISTLTQKQRAEYLYHLAKKLGLDPASKPFDIIPVGGGTKLMVYANKGAAAQLQKIRNLKVEKVYSGPVPYGPSQSLNNIYMVEVVVTSPDGRTSFNVGTVNVEGLKGDLLANKIMSCHTKATRRAVLIHEGLGFTDESELDTTPGVMKEITPPAYPQPYQFATLPHTTPAPPGTWSSEPPDTVIGTLTVPENKFADGLEASTTGPSTKLPPVKAPSVKIVKKIKEIK